MSHNQDMSRHIILMVAKGKKSKEETIEYFTPILEFIDHDVFFQDKCVHDVSHIGQGYLQLCLCRS